MIGQPEVGVFIPTRSGRRLDLAAPASDDIEIVDIAAGLARRFRWSGQTDYTVAQHSVAVSTRLEGDEARWGLLHDAAEAFYPDVARPLKARLMVCEPFGPRQLIREFRDCEDRLLMAIANRFGLPWPIPPSVHEADDRELAREARDLFEDRPMLWAIGPNHADPYPDRIDVSPWPLVENLFLKRYAELFGD